MRVIGVTGAPGSGKTAVAAAFAELGAGVVSLDEIGHELLAEPEVAGEIRATFSSGVFRILDGEVAREKLARLVFADAVELAKLNRILHPRMAARVRSEVERLRGCESATVAEGALVIEGALLVEMDLAGLCDRIVLVRAPRKVRLGRLARSRGWDEGELARRERAQLDDEARLERAQAHESCVVLDNASDRDAMRAKVKELWEEWK